VNGVIVLSPIEPVIKEAIDKIEEKVDKHSGEINELKITCAVTNQRLDGIEKSQLNIELGQMKNRELSLENFNNMNQIINKNTDSLLSISNGLFGYLAEKDRCDNKTNEKLNEGWNKREITVASISGFIALMGIAYGVSQVVM
jgi:hypothetical protein